jgi:hypothetical protein
MPMNNYNKTQQGTNDKQQECEKTFTNIDKTQWEEPTSNKSVRRR